MAPMTTGLIGWGLIIVADLFIVVLIMEYIAP